MELLVNIDVDDLERGIAFYCNAFGLTLGRRFGADGVELLGATSPIYLLVKPQGSSATPDGKQSRSYRRHWSPLHLDFTVPDVEQAVARAVAVGAILEKPIITNNWGKLALMADPFGHGFCFVQFVGRGYDEITTTGM